MTDILQKTEEFSNETCIDVSFAAYAGRGAIIGGRINETPAPPQQPLTAAEQLLSLQEERHELQAMLSPRYVGEVLSEDQRLAFVARLSELNERLETVSKQFEEENAEYLSKLRSTRPNFS